MRHYRFLLFICTVTFLGMVSAGAFMIQENSRLGYVAGVFAILNMLNIFSHISDEWFGKNDKL